MKLLLDNIYDRRVLEVILLFFIAFGGISFIRNKIIRLTVSVLIAVFLLFQIISLYFVGTFIGYSFYVHFNVRDIGGMFGIFKFQLLLAFIVTLILISIFYFSPYVNDIVKKQIITLNPKSLKFYNPTKLIFIALCIIVFSKSGKMPNELNRLTEVLKTKTTYFEKALSSLGMKDYLLKDDSMFQSGKNFIIISLESIEKSYLKEELSSLTPNLTTLSQQWNYFDLHQNIGGGWTSGALYTLMTGFPAFFGEKGNYIFQEVYFSKIISILQILKNAGYHSTFLIGNADFSGTKEMLNVFGIDEIIDKRMEKYIKLQKSNLEFMVSAVDYMVGNFVNKLKENNTLDNTTIFILPDHLKMGDASIFKDAKKRGLFIITNGNDTVNYKNNNGDKSLHQIDLPRFILKNANIPSKQLFLTDYISTDKDSFLSENLFKITSINTSGILRLGEKPFQIEQADSNYTLYLCDTLRFIAHAGGSIDNYDYTNSLQALNYNYQKGFRLFELDIIKTDDNRYVAAHDWDTWKRQTNFKGQLPITEKEFLTHKILSKYTPIGMKEINNWFKLHPDAVLVTDKINEPAAFSSQFIDKNRLMMELFTLDAVEEGIKCSLQSAMPSERVIKKWETMQSVSSKK